MRWRAGLEPKRVITLFGCGGDRDRAKRPMMGEAAAELSDFVVLTSDNPRSEDPLAIINDALLGLWRHDTPHVEEPDREKAIRLALSKAAAGRHRDPGGQGARDLPDSEGPDHPFGRPRGGPQGAAQLRLRGGETMNLDFQDVARAISAVRPPPTPW